MNHILQIIPMGEQNRHRLARRCEPPRKSWESSPPLVMPLPGKVIACETGNISIISHANDG